MKKSKLLLVLVVAILVCSMLFTLIACNNDKDKDKETEDEQTEDTTPTEDPGKAILSEAGKLITNAIKAENKAAMKYTINVPVADVINKGVMTNKNIVITLGAVIDPTKADTAAKNKSEVMIRVAEKLGNEKNNTNLFNLYVDAADMYLEVPSETMGVKLPGFILGDVLNGTDKLPKSSKIASYLNIALNMLFSSNPEKTVEGDVTTYKLTGDMGILAEIISSFVGGLPNMDAITKVDTNGIMAEYLSNIFTGVGADLGNLIGKIVPTITMTVKNNAITNFDLAFATPFDENPGKLLIKPEFKTDDAGIKAIADTLDTIADADTKANFKETGVINAVISGSLDAIVPVKTDASNPDPNAFVQKTEPQELYTYEINANIDGFSVLRNFLNLGTDKAKANPEKLLVGTDTKIFGTIVKNEADPSNDKVVATVAFDEASLGTSDIILTFDAALLPEGFLKAVFGDKVAAQTGVQTIRLNPAALIIDNNKANSAAPKAPEVKPVDESKLASAPTLYSNNRSTVVFKKSDAKNVAKYVIKVEGDNEATDLVVIDDTNKNYDYLTGELFMISDLTGKDAEIYAVNAAGNKISKSLKFKNSAGAMGIVESAFGMLTGINFLNGINLNVENTSIESLLQAIVYNDYFVTAGGKTIVEAFGELVKGLGFDVVNANIMPYQSTINTDKETVAAKMAATKLYGETDETGVKAKFNDATTRKVTGLATVGKDSKVVITNADKVNVKVAENKLVYTEFTATEVENFFAGATVEVNGNAVKVGKVLGLDKTKAGVQTVQLVLINADSEAFIEALDANAYLPTQVVTAEVKIKVAA